MQLISRLFIRPSGMLLAFLLMVPSAAMTAKESKMSDTSSAMKAQVQEAYGKLPLMFEANHGQTDRQVKFQSHGQGYTIFLTPTGVVLPLRQAAATPGDLPADYQQTMLRMQLIGANPSQPLRGMEELHGKVNYFIGKDPKRWRTNIPNSAIVQVFERAV